MATLIEQELEVPIERETLPGQKHPYEHLLDSGRREQYIKICVPLYRASMEGNLEAARVILEDRKHLVRYSITEQKETPLHVVAAAHSDPEFVRYLVDLMSEDDLKLQNEEGNNAFCVAATAGNRLMAMRMLQKNRELLTIRGSGEMMPLYLAAFHKQCDMITYLYDHSEQMSSNGWTDDDINSVFLECIKIECFDVALRMLNDREELSQDKYNLWNVLHVFAQKTHVFHPMTCNDRLNIYWEKWFYDPDKSSRSGPLTRASKEILKFKKESEAAKHLLSKIWEKIVVKNKDEIDAILRGPVVKIDEKDTYPSGILFVAAENGNINFLVDLIREYPDLIWKTNDDGQTIFHIAVNHGYASILDLLYELRAMKDKITQLKDKHGNTLLHSASMNTGGNLQGAGFALQRKLLCFKNVKAMLHPSFNLLKNAAGQTPKELFNHNHKDLLPKGEKWVKEISNQCMLVATLVTTITFSAAFTIPGGYNQNTGFPMFLRNTPFLVFVILDAVSFIFSSFALLSFLSLGFCRYYEVDFLYSVPLILFYGLFALTYSIITLMAAFTASFFVLYRYKLLPVPIIMTSLAILAIFVFTFRIIVPVIDAWRPKNKTLFNQNRRR